MTPFLRVGDRVTLHDSEEGAGTVEKIEGIYVVLKMDGGERVLAIENYLHLLRAGENGKDH